MISRDQHYDHNIYIYTTFSLFFFFFSIRYPEDKIVTGILVHNHLGIYLFAKALYRTGIDSVKYGKLLDYFEGYVVTKSDSLLAGCQLFPSK